MILANIALSGSRLELQRSAGLASVIDAGVGHYTLVFAKDCENRAYTVATSSDERGYAYERLDVPRTRSEYTISVKEGGVLSDAGVNVVIHE